MSLVGNRQTFWSFGMQSLKGDGSVNSLPASALSSSPSSSPLSSSSSLSATSESGSAVMDETEGDFHLNPIVPYNLMLTMYSRNRNADKFFGILQRLNEVGISPDIYTYNALFKLRENRGELEQLLHLATDMLDQNIPLDVVSYNIIIEALGNRGWAFVKAIGPFGGSSGIASAHRVLQLMSQLKVRREARTYELMFSALFKVDLCEEIVELWNEMLLRGTVPTAEACSTVMKAFYRLSHPDEALSIWQRLKSILLDYIRHLEEEEEKTASAGGSPAVRTLAMPRTKPLSRAENSWDPILPTARTENILLDIFKETGQLNAFFETWHLFRRADINPLSNSCAALMEVYLDIADYRSGLNVYQWLQHVKIQPSPRTLAVHIALLAYQSASSPSSSPMRFSRLSSASSSSSDSTAHHSTATSSIPEPMEQTPSPGHSSPPPRLHHQHQQSEPRIVHPEISDKTVDPGSLSRIRQEWMSLRALDSSFHSPQLSTFEAVIAAFYYANDYIGVFDAFKVMMESIYSRTPPALSAPTKNISSSSDSSSSSPSPPSDSSRHSSQQNGQRRGNRLHRQQHARRTPESGQEVAPPPSPPVAASDAPNHGGSAENKTQSEVRNRTYSHHHHHPHYHYHHHHPIRELRHVPPIRGVLDISSLVLVLESYIRSKSFYDTNTQLLEQIEIIRRTLDMETTSEYETAMRFASSDFVLPQQQMSHEALANELNDESGEVDPLKPWKFTSVGSSKLFSALKKSPHQPRFIPTSWNIAIPSPPIPKDEGVL